MCDSGFIGMGRPLIHGELTCCRQYGLARYLAHPGCRHDGREPNAAVLIPGCRHHQRGLIRHLLSGIPEHLNRRCPYVEVFRFQGFFNSCWSTFPVPWLPRALPAGDAHIADRWYPGRQSSSAPQPIRYSHPFPSVPGGFCSGTCIRNFRFSSSSPISAPSIFAGVTSGREG